MVHRTIDVRGTACPMNYVKVMMALGGLEPGEWLDVILDDGKALVDVPRRAREDGHKVAKVTPVDDGYRVTIEKGQREPRVAEHIKNNGGDS